MFKEDVMADKEFALKQRDPLGFDVLVKLIDGRELQFIRKGKNIDQNYSVDILSLQDKSKKTLFIGWKWLINCFIFFTATLLLLKFLPDYLDKNKNIYLAVILYVGLLGCIVSLIKFWKNTSLKQIFYSRNAHVPIIILSAGKPSKKIFSSFIRALETRITKFRSHMDVDEDKQLTGEIKMLRRLSDDGVIAKKDYEKAKAKLFSGFDSNFVNRES